MAKNASCALYGVLGYPAGHSLSPAMHQAAFDRLAMAAQYKTFETPPESLERFLNDARADLSGFNVTVPYKEKIIAFLDYVSSDGRLIGAVNTVKVKARRLEGFNTDGQGFMEDLAEKGVYPKGANICVLGAGGASRAVCFSLANAVPAQVSVFNRAGHKAAVLIEQLKQQFPEINFRQADSVDALGIPEAHLLINATSVGMKPDDPLLVEERLLHKGLFVYDLVYAPPETRLLKAAKEKGCRTANGLGMLLHQGMLSFKIWTGLEPPRKEMEQALLKTCPATRAL